MSTETGDDPTPTIDYLEPFEAYTVRPHVPKARLKGASLTKEERKQVSERRENAATALHFDMEEWFASTLAKAEELAQTHNKTVQYITSLFFSSAPRAVEQDGRKVNIWNAFCWRLARDKTTGE